VSDYSCYECLYHGTRFKWQDNDYCNKHKCKVDGAQSACSNFLSDSHNCCYDCDEGKDMGFKFFCKANRTTIDNPASYYCYRFKY